MDGITRTLPGAWLDVSPTRLLTSRAPTEVGSRKRKRLVTSDDENSFSTETTGSESQFDIPASTGSASAGSRRRFWEEDGG